MAEPKKDAEKKDVEKKEAKKPAAKKAAAKKPAAKTTAKKDAVAKKPAAKTETPTSTAKKPAAKKKPAASGTRAAAAKGATESKAKAKPKAAKEPAETPVVKARAGYVRVAPRKARLVADQIRGMPLDDALTTLRFSPRGAASEIAKLINSAAANAENNHDLVADDLRVTEITVNEGPTLRRYRPRAMGRATRINKRTSHINVALTPEEEV